MGRRRTAWGRTEGERGQRLALCRAIIAGAVLCATAALPAPGAQAAGLPTAGSYAFADDARTVRAATSTTDAEHLEPGSTYRSTLPGSGKIYYRLELDATSNAYVSATAVPRPGTTVAATDGLKVTVQDADSHTCSIESQSLGAARSPHPIAAWGAREVAPDKSLCQGAGTYYVVVERLDSPGASSEDWDLELLPVSEPPLRQAGRTDAPEAWDSAPPAPLSGEPVKRPGGAGFASATPVGQGVWQGDIQPGQTLFYAVPVDWGRQLHATAELGSTREGNGYAVAALEMSLYNPVRAHVEDVGVGYDGRQKSASLAPVPPVTYANRHAVGDQVGGMRFAGSYYLVVHLAAQVADRFGDGPFGLTLRVRLGGARASGPDYAGQPVPRDAFEVTAQERLAAAEGGTAGNDTAMRALAAGGIGTGTALLVLLAVWTATARRRTSAQTRVSAQNPTP
ncbi:hypothetical protein [Streptomyces griseus]|uniref:hypothetical protein n=1 Tax=Streptomyces griseus TaxID=1911 RepID=UPI0005633436|nr:hypothetical protein [Streptomyces griseus]